MNRDSEPTIVRTRVCTHADIKRIYIRTYIKVHILYLQIIEFQSFKSS